jgi:hypothetical protein
VTTGPNTGPSGLRLRLDLDEETLDALCDLLLPRLLERLADRDDQPRFMTVKAAAAYMCTTETAVRHQINRDGLPIVQAARGHRIIIDRLALDAWLAGRG